MRERKTEGSGDIGLRLRMRGEERRIAAQHERLDALCREVNARIDKEGAARALEEFMLFTAALDAHMTVEEDIYFPALHGLREESASELGDLVAEHDALRSGVSEIRLLLESDEPGRARSALDQLAKRVAEHELAEEDLIARITEGPVTRYGHSALES